MQDKAIWTVRYNFAEQMRQLYRRLYVTLDVLVLRWFLKKELAHLWDKWRRWRRCRDVLEAYLEKWNAPMEEVSMEFPVGSATDFKTVKIGGAEWMAENLAIDDGGDGIFKNEENGEYYYTWDAAMRIAKAIPGWHLPSAEEWNAAAEACGAEVVDNKYKDNPYWWDYEGTEKLYDTLRVLPVGYYSGGCFYSVGSCAYFWSATEYGSSSAYSRDFVTSVAMGQFASYKVSGFSVRLVKDGGIQCGNSR